MNEQIRGLAKQAGMLDFSQISGGRYKVTEVDIEEFAELIVRECCLALWTEECHTSDLAFDEVKRNATRIKEHFGIDPNEITEDMLARSIKWMEQQLVDKKHFGVEE
jgi:hypothetical protein